MKIFTTGILVAMALGAVSESGAGERALYVGEGRFYGKDQGTTDSAILRQRNHEQTLRAQERNRQEERYERDERREREFEREMKYDLKSP